MKLPPLIAAIQVFCTTTTTLHATIQLGNIQILPNINSSIEYTSNAAKSNQEISDTIFRAASSVSVQNDNAIISAKVGAKMEIIRFDKLDENDDEDISFFAAISFPHGLDVPYDFTANYEYAETTEGDSEFGEIVETQEHSAAIAGNYQINPNFSTKLSLNYSLTKTAATQIETQDSQSIGIPISFDYKFSSTLSYGIGYRTRLQSVSGEGISSFDNALFAHANGRLLPLLNGGLSLGIQHRSSENEDQIAPYISSDLSWQATNLTSIQLKIDADFETSTSNRSSQGIGVSLNADHTFAPRLNGSASLQWNQIHFFSNSGNESDRKDQEITLESGLSKKLVHGTSISLSASYTINDSTLSSSTYDVLAISLEASRQF